jgi:ribosomal protein S18 acetylase RimI-like enzyme
MEVELRPARPDDRGDIAGLMYSAGPELFDFLYRTDRVAARDFIVHEFRSGRGIGDAMVRHQLATARERGYRLFSLDVSVDNPRAEALYRRLGLHVVREKHFTGKRPGFPVPGQRKMELVLG